MSDDIESTVGDGAKNVNAGKGNKQEITENNADNNVTINIPMPVWPNPPVAPEQKSSAERRQLPLELEREFRQSFERLTTAIVELKATVTVNNTLTEAQIELLRTQVDAVAEMVKKAKETGDKGLPGLNVYVPDKAPPRWIWPVLTSFGTVVILLLAIIAWRLTMGGV